MNKIYDEDYYTKAKHSPYIGYPESNTGTPVREVLRYRMIEIIRYFPAGTSLIDWGCATGILVKLLRDNGINAVGYDFGEWAVNNKECNEVYLVDAVAVREKDIPMVDVMYSCDFLEHLPSEDVYNFLLKTSKRCKKEMWHYVPFYKKYNTPAPGPGGVHLTQVNSAWWKDVFSKIPEFEIIRFPLDEFGGMIVCKRKEELK